jgi:hypothetical protein
MKPTSHHYIAVTIAFIILVASVTVYFFINAQVRNEAAKTAATFVTVAQDQATVAAEESASSTFSSTALSRALLQSYLIQDSNTVSFIEQVEGVAKQSGASVSIASISADDLTMATAGTIGHIQAHISAQGSWSNVMRALHIIEDLPYSLTIDNVSVHAEGGGIWGLEFNMMGLIVK